MIHYNQAIVYEIGSASYMQTTQSSTASDSPPTMSPINSQDNNGGNLIQDLTPDVKTNTNLQTGLTAIMDKIWFIVKVACVVIVLFLALSIFGVGKMKHKKEGDSPDGKSKVKDYAEKGLVALLIFWLAKKFFGKDIKDGVSKVNDKLHHNSNKESTGGEPIHPRADTPDKQDNYAQEDGGFGGVPPRRDSNGMPPRRDASSGIPPRRNSNGIPPRSPNGIPPRRESPPRAVPKEENKIPPRDTDLWGDDSSTFDNNLFDDF